MTDTYQQLINAAVLETNEAGDNVAVRIPIDVWRSFTLAVSPAPDDILQIKFRAFEDAVVACRSVSYTDPHHQARDAMKCWNVFRDFRKCAVANGMKYVDVKHQWPQIDSLVQEIAMLMGLDASDVPNIFTQNETPST